MSEEEKKAIEYLKRHIIPVYGKKGNIEYMLNDVLLNLIEKQQKELNKEKGENETLKQLLQGYLYEMYKYYKEKCKNLFEENTNLKILIERKK